MAGKKTENASEERLFTIPLRKEWLKVPLNKRAKRSIRTIKSHLSRHMKVPETGIRISSELNRVVWVRGAGKPPSRVRIKARLDAASGLLHAMLPDEKPPEKEKPKKEAMPAEQKPGEKEAGAQDSGKPEDSSSGKAETPEQEERASPQKPEKTAIKKDSENDRKKLPEKKHPDRA